MRFRLLTAVAAIILGSVAHAGRAEAAALPVVSNSGASMHWWTGHDAHMTIDVRAAGATDVSVQLTGYVFGSQPFPGLHLYKRTPRFALSHAGGVSWTATRRDDAAIGVAMSDRSIVAVLACNAAGCADTNLYFHLPGE